ncbi:MAG: trimeric intracellular cation channel family protein [Rickettsiales bacterium]|jgi:uncharacterized membrane protein YeiH|nr:trimeric intracellular cation channel family protein [Rickettsiales bacterium]
MDYLEIASIIGTFAFALSGVLIGVKKNLDVMGVFILAFLTASGGGAIRDIFINRTPTILTDINPYLITICIILIFKVLKLDHEKLRFEEKRLFIFSDTVGLVAFAINGALVGVMLELSIFGVLTIGFLTSVGGGIIRDILVNDIPSTLQSGFYGTVSIIIGVMIFTLSHFNVELTFCLPVIFLFGTLLRFYTLTKKIRLPKL